MELIKIITDKETPLGKGIRTAYQGLGALVISFPFIIALPQVQELIKTYPTGFVLYLNALAGIIAYFQNKRG